MTLSPFRPWPERWSAELHMDADPIVARGARRYVRTQLGHWHLAELAEDACLITSELITNAITATIAAPIPADVIEPDYAVTVALRVRRAFRSLYVEVWDRNPAPPLRTDADDFDETGRGLALVTAYSARWHHYASHAAIGGKVIWAKITIPADLAARSAAIHPHRPHNDVPAAVTPDCPTSCLHLSAPCS
jgi:hypothetical protein